MRKEPWLPPGLLFVSKCERRHRSDVVKFCRESTDEIVVVRATEQCIRGLPRSSFGCPGPDLWQRVCCRTSRHEQGRHPSLPLRLVSSCGLAIRWESISVIRLCDINAAQRVDFIILDTVAEPEDGCEASNCELDLAGEGLIPRLTAQSGSKGKFDLDVGVLAHIGGDGLNDCTPLGGLSFFHVLLPENEDRQ